MTTINTSSNNKAAAAEHTVGCRFPLFSFYLFILSSLFWKFFSPNYFARWTSFSVFGFSVFPAFCFPFSTIFHFHILYFPFVAQTWFIYGSSRNGTKPTEYCIRNRYSCTSMYIFPAVIFVGAYEGRMGKVDYSQHMRCS